MKLASLLDGRDGQLVIVNTSLTRAVAVPEIAATLQQALDDWQTTRPRLESIYHNLNNGKIEGQPFDEHQCESPLPRAYHWVDGSAYVNHVELVRKARKAEMPEAFWTNPIVYQGGSDTFLRPHGPIPAADEKWGIDMEAEVAYVVDDVPMGVNAETAVDHIQLIMLVNDVSLRNLIPDELAKGFGFYQSKPSSAFSPVAVTPDELGSAWADGKLHLPLHASLNGALVGAPNAGVDMTFTPAQLIAHTAKTRKLSAGTIVGTGTVSNRNRSSGSCCLVEKRMLEIIANGEATTPYLQFGDRVRIEMFDHQGKSVFGAIDQIVTQYDISS